MNSNIRPIVLFAVTLIFLCFVAIWIFTLPAFLNRFNLTNTSNIGSAIGGITTPVIGIFSAIFLYLALSRQTESNALSRLKNESDIIFLLLAQLDDEIARFYTTQTQGEKVHHSTGLEGLNKFTNEYRYEWKNLAKPQDDFSFKHFFESGQIMIVIESYELIEQRIKIANLDQETKQLFSQKIDSYYRWILRNPLRDLSEAWKEYDTQRDELTVRIELFLQNRKS